MKFLLLFFTVAWSSVMGTPIELDYFADLNNDMDGLDAFEDRSLFDSRTFNLSIPNLFNSSSILGIGAAVIIGIILFEVALYALDVYYNQTYGFGGSSSGGYGYQRRKDGEQDFYEDYPKYNDPFAGTFRALATGWKYDKILEWIALGQETYEAGTAVLVDTECQKKMICEIYRDSSANGSSSGQARTSTMGVFGARARQGFDLVETLGYLSLPDVVTNTVDEFQDAKSRSIDESNTTCEEMYPDCEYSVEHIFQKYGHLH